jgi:hypothetical protein
VARTCANHAEREAPTACFQCRKPVCAACTTVAADGSFCSPECGVLWRALRERPGEDALFRKTGMALKGMAILLGVLVVLIGVHAAARRGSALAKRVDVLGRMFDGLDALKLDQNQREQLR